MNRHRPEWKLVRFGDVVRQVKDHVTPDSGGIDRYVAGEHMDSDDLRIRRWGQVGDGYLGPAFHMRFKPGHVLYGSRRTYLRKVAVAHFEGICANTTFVLEPKDPDELLPEFLPFVMQVEAFHEHSKRESKGSVNPYVNFSDIAWYQFALPTPTEQRRFLEAAVPCEQMLRALQDAREALEAASRRVLESYDLAAFEQRAVSRLLTEDPRNGVSPTCNSEGRGHPTLPVGCVYSGVVDTVHDLKYAEVDAAVFDRFRLRRHDVLVVRGNGNRALVGRAGIVEDTASECFYPDLLIRLRFDAGQLEPCLAVHMWNCVPIHAALVGRAKSTNGIYKINGADIRAHELPVPPRPVQEKMLEVIGKCGEARLLLEARAASASEVRASVLKTLSGASDDLH